MTVGPKMLSVYNVHLYSYAYKIGPLENIDYIDRD